MMWWCMYQQIEFTPSTSLTKISDRWESSTRCCHYTVKHLRVDEMLWPIWYCIVGMSYQLFQSVIETFLKNTIDWTGTASWDWDGSVRSRPVRSSPVQSSPVQSSSGSGSLKFGDDDNDKGYLYLRLRFKGYFWSFKFHLASNASITFKKNKGQHSKLAESCFLAALRFELVIPHKSYSTFDTIECYL